MLDEIIDDVDNRCYFFVLLTFILTVQITCKSSADVN